MAVNISKIVVGGKTFAESTRKSPQEQTVTTKSPVKEESFVEQEVTEKTTSSFILKSSSKFHRDMIE